MKTGIFGVMGLSLLVLSGCGKESASSEFKVASTDQLVNGSLPAIRHACPGLDKYSNVLENIRVQNNFRTSILFDVPESTQIPDAYKAVGQTCYVEIDAAGKNIYIEKLACKSVCLDQLNTPDGQLKIELTEGKG